MRRSLCILFVVTKQINKERIATIASRQGGQIAYSQLTRLGVATSTIHGWERDGYLKHSLPSVFSVGHTAPSWESRLWSAVLYAGPGAMLSHGTAARWRALIDFAPAGVHVSTPRQTRSIQSIHVHGRRPDLEREFHKGIPVTSIPVTMVDLAATSGERVVHRALGQLDFQKLLDVDALLGACRRGRQGAAALREAIDGYDPRRKYANGRLEETFYSLCKARGLPLPLLNVYVHDIKCDAYWPQQGLVAELDSELAHSSPAQRRRDRRNDMILRRHGLTVHRYDWDLVHEQPAEVSRDVLDALARLMAERRVRAS
jgi:hypothetical protein